MSSYYPLAPGKAHQRLIHTRNSPLRFLEVEYLTLAAGTSWTRLADGRESVIVPLAGDGAIIVEGTASLQGKIGRDDVFGATPSAAYVPPGHALTVTAAVPFQAVLVTAVWTGAAAGPLILPAGEVVVKTVGREFWRREVRTIFGPDGVTARLLVGETINPPGHWSGMPPHKHDASGPTESLLEEVYYYRLSPPDGYLVQLFYDREGWHAEQLVREEGAAAITRGYHPTVAAPGTTGYYLWALAGPEKSYKVSIDPVFDWMRSEVRS